LFLPNLSNFIHSVRKVSPEISEIFWSINIFFLSCQGFSLTFLTADGSVGLARLSDEPGYGFKIFNQKPDSESTIRIRKRYAWFCLPGAR
jgi:hypothetical protein